MAINQGYLFLIFTLNGILIGFLFDIFRTLRKSFKTSNLVTYIEDFIFWILSGISIIFFLYKFSDGNLRLYIFCGLGFGIIFYMLTLSKIIIKSFVFIISFFVKIINKFLHLIHIPIKIIYNFIDKIILKNYTKIKDIIGKNIKKLNYKEKFKKFCKKS